MEKSQTLRWLKLDNAAKIYPAARRKNWSNLFRQSVTLTEEVDTHVLQLALYALNVQKLHQTEPYMPIKGTPAGVPFYCKRY